SARSRRRASCSWRKCAGVRRERKPCPRIKGFAARGSSSRPKLLGETLRHRLQYPQDMFLSAPVFRREETMVDLSGVDHKSIVDRAKAIILTPKEEWPKIVVEPKDQGDILKSYVLPL